MKIIIFTGIVLVSMLGLGIYLSLKTKITVKKITIVAILIAMASAGRILCAFVPSLQPVSFIVMMTSLYIGRFEGFSVGVGTGLVSNFVMGITPYTIPQMFCWGLMGALTFKLPKWVNVGIAFIWGFVFGWLMNSVWYFVMPEAKFTLWAYLSFCVTSFSFDLIHAATNGALMACFDNKVFKKIFMKWDKPDD